MIKRLIWTIWTPMSSVLKKADKLNLSLSLSLNRSLSSRRKSFNHMWSIAAEKWKNIYKSFQCFQKSIQYDLFTCTYSFVYSCWGILACGSGTFMTTQSPVPVMSMWPQTKLMFSVCVSLLDSFTVCLHSPNGLPLLLTHWPPGDMRMI